MKQTTFASGIQELFYEVRIVGGHGLPYRTECLINGKIEAGLARTGNVVPNGTAFVGSIVLRCITGCVGNRPLERGSYQLNVYLADLPTPYRSATATVR
jgi:hypothetical protein